MKVITKQDLMNLADKFETLQTEDERVGFFKGLYVLGIVGSREQCGWNPSENTRTFFMLDNKESKTDKDVQWVLDDSLMQSENSLARLPEDAKDDDTEKRRRCLKHLVKTIERIFDEAAH